MADSNPNTQEIERTIQRRFWVRVKPDPSGCWLWTGGTRDNGYGTFAIQREGGRWTQTTAHRFAYQDQVGDVPDGYEVDHLCRVRNCVRPDHLEATTVIENRKRRDAQTVFDVSTDIKPLPVIPPKPLPPAPPAKRDALRFCPNWHEYAIVGKVINGRGRSGVVRFTCAACRSIKQSARRKGNYASTRTHCPKGHPYSGDNLWQRVKFKNGRLYNARECWACTRKRNRLAALRLKESKNCRAQGTQWPQWTQWTPHRCRS